jgi:hypothetical protein
VAEELLPNGRESVQGVLDRALNLWISRESDHETIPVVIGRVRTVPRPLTGSYSCS